jgi:predicted AAA+ superfamily ATPase
MNEQISQSLAGRTYVSHLLPFGINELEINETRYLESIFNGFYPRLHDSNIAPTDFYPSYIQTYIERDVRSIKTIENLDLFTRFLSLCAGRIGQVLNLSSLANDTGIAVNTAKAWLSLLESSFILYQLKPWYKNFNKRLIKSPKLYFYDTGLACSLLKIKNASMLQTHYLYGSLYENFIISEIRKAFYHGGLIPSIYFWRESNGTEIDCIIEQSNNSIMAIEIKGGTTFTKDYLKNLNRMPDSGIFIEKYLIHPGDHSTKIKDVNIVGKSDFGQFLKDKI